MQVDRLRLVGFKSFVDAAELAIEPGLTGIVGPNGCGKSNLAEALRWVMGETSARRLRGGAMDDVIFAGAAGRPPRNIAEVALRIHNGGRAAPPPFNERDEIEIVRRIERGGGSAYRVNGREVRARDVQLLFADAASGGHSGAIVGQGRVAALIEAKPAERRQLLEEAAGTAGLQVRRRETEIRLQAADDNLARLDDVIATMATQLETLKRQARQAQRYRRLAEQVRRSEALLFCARWRAAEAEAEQTAAQLRDIEGAVAEGGERATAERSRHEAAAAALPPLRLAETEAAAELQRLTEARNGLEQELQRVIAARGAAERRRAQLAADGEREETQLGEAAAALARLSEERSALSAADRPVGPAHDQAAVRLQDAAGRLAVAEAALQRATEAAAQAAARRAALERRRRDLDERRTRLEARRAEAGRQRAALAAGMVPAAAVGAAAAAIAESELRVETGRAAIEAGERELAARQAREAAALDALRRIEVRLARLEPEAEALRALLAPPPGASGGPPILAAVGVAAGFEAAIGALFEDELSAPLTENTGHETGRFWIDLGAIDGAATLPEGAHPLADAVTAPAALGRRLAQAGWVDTEEAGYRLQPLLAPGQRLVDRDGRSWRWDGFVQLASDPSAAAQNLRQQNRLAVLADEIARTETERRSAASAAATARADCRGAAEADRLARAELREAEAALVRARAAETELARRALTAEARDAALADTLDRLAADLAETAAQTAENEHDLAALPVPALTRAALEAARAEAAEARRLEADARAEIERLTREAAIRRERLSAIDLDERSWRTRADGSVRQRAALDERRRLLDQEAAELAARPAAIATESEVLARGIAGAAAAARHTADARVQGETRLRQAVESSRLADAALAELRERRARLEVLRDGAAETLTRLARDIGERIAAPPEALAELAGLAAGEAPPAAAETAARLDRLIRERDGIGPVNLVAENEAAEIGAQVADLQRERAELTEAIARLRRGVAALDREARQRLAAAFELVNRHFAALFARLFGGGKAHLALAGDDDPLAAGLEIMASPSGKRLQMLSLLSGGEQALTALALIFAVFLTNPAPVCVLDEVDAPLDDANVERLCSLVAEIADTTGTRFLLVTHHRITMARADRLFGVTMAESGVSQLVSVDLARAVRLRQTG